eukprot:COSAG05_NODE_835_length_7055_cov_5.505463_4_plen_119_part_00
MLRCLAEGVEPPQLRQAFGRACYIGDEPIARLLLQKAQCVRLKCPNLRDDSSEFNPGTGLCTPLFSACFDGHEAVVRLLVEHSCDIENISTPTIQHNDGSVSARRCTALNGVCYHGHF